MDTRAAELENLLANSFKRREIEKLLAVIPEIAFGAEATLHAIGPDQFAGEGIANHQMVAAEIVAVAIEADASGACQSLAQLAIKDQIAQALASDQIPERLGHAGAKVVCGGERILASVL